MKNIALAFVLIALLQSCKTDNTKANESNNDNKVTQTEQTGPVFEMLPREILTRMWNEAEMLDYIFHDLPFSMSQNEKPSIQANMTYIDKYAQPTIPQGCKPAARQFYQVNGNIELEADVYFSQGCYFYVFIIDGKPSYANKMHEEGIKFFKTMIGRAMDASKSMGG